MDEIKELLSSIIQQTGHVSNNKAEIKRLIQLVQTEQLKLISESSDAKIPFVSAQIDWEEL